MWLELIEVKNDIFLISNFPLRRWFECNVSVVTHTLNLIGIHNHIYQVFRSEQNIVQYIHCTTQEQKKSAFDSPISSLSFMEVGISWKIASFNLQPSEACGQKNVPGIPLAKHMRLRVWVDRSRNKVLDWRKNSNQSCMEVWWKVSRQVWKWGSECRWVGTRREECRRLEKGRLWRALWPRRRIYSC